MIPSVRTVAAIVVLAMIAASPAVARTVRAGSVVIADPWTRPAPVGAMAVGYMGLMNAGTTPVVLVSATSPAARAVSLHQTTITDGVARMAALPNGVQIPPGGQASFAPGGYHLMLEGLVKPLALGTSVPLTLQFSNGLKVRIGLNVQLQPGVAAAAGTMNAVLHSNH